jgi:hypothetical protein
MSSFLWIEEETILTRLNDSTERMESIKVFCVYIDSHLEIKDFFVQYVDLESNKKESVLSKERLLYLIQTNKHYTPDTQYKFMNGATFLVDIPPEHLSSFLKDDIHKLSFLKEFYMVDDIMIPVSLDIFHSVNSIYLFFKETPLKSSGLMTKTHKIRPILKTCEDLSVNSLHNTNRDIEENQLSSIKRGDTKKTKRVRIQEHPPLNRSKKNTSCS